MRAADENIIVVAKIGRKKTCRHPVNGVRARGGVLSDSMSRKRSAVEAVTLAARHGTSE